MKPSELQGTLQRNGLASLYLVVGEEDYLRDQVIRLIQAQSLQKGEGLERGTAESEKDFGFSYEVLYGDETDAQDVLSRVQAVSFFSSHCVVIVKWAEKLSARDGEILIPYFQAPPASSTLVLSAARVDGRLKWVQVVKKHAVVVDCAPLYDNQRLGWVQGEAKRLGLRLDTDAAQLLKDCAREGLYAVQGEMGKLALYVRDGKPVNSRQILAIQGREPGVSIFDLAGALARRAPGEALFILEKNLEAGEAPLRLLGALIWQYRQLWKAREGLAQGLTESMAARQAGVPPFRQQEFLRIVKQFPLNHFRGAFEKFSRVDLALKGWAAGSPRRTLTRLLVELCHHTPGRWEGRPVQSPDRKTASVTRTGPR